MKRDIAEFVSRCLTCQQVKTEHQKPAGLLQSLCETLENPCFLRKNKMVILVENPEFS